jgi:integrase
MMDIVFRSILKDELASYMEFVKLSVVDYRAYQRTLMDFDYFLSTEEFVEKEIYAEIVSRWLDGFTTIKPTTKKSKLTHVRKFAGYLMTLGIKADIPELPRIPSDYVPYVFSMDEMAKMFEAVDDLVLDSPNSRVAAELPMLLRLLYGCGLRLGEATELTWEDIDTDIGVITIRAAKGQKQRLVPMCDELTRILKLYRISPYFKVDDSGPIFRKNDGSVRTKGAYWSIFNRILCDLGIKNPQTVKHGARGPCIHSLRHTFTLNSLLKAEAEGRTFIETVPFLSTYLGHDGLMQTDIYLKARHELYTDAHAIIANYTDDVFPVDVFPEG